MNTTATVTMTLTELETMGWESEEAARRIIRVDARDIATAKNVTVQIVSNVGALLATI